MKLVFQGTPEEQRWFKERLSCPNGVPCPRTDTRICGVKGLGASYDCKMCCFNTQGGEMANVAFVDQLPTTSSSEGIVEQLQVYIASQHKCEECAFYQNGTCYFDYHCPQDFKKENADG